MELIKGVVERRSIRKYKEAGLPKALIETIIDEAKFCPSWAHTKTVRYRCVVNPVLKEKIAESTDFNAQYIKEAPALFVITAIKGRSGTDRSGSFYYHTSKEWTMLDAGIAIQTLCLVAHSHGVGTLIMGVFNGPETKGILEIPEEEELVAMVSAGFPDEAPIAPKRKETKDILQILE